MSGCPAGNHIRVLIALTTTACICDTAERMYNTPLPIELVDFKAESKGNCEVQVTWNVDKEEEY